MRDEGAGNREAASIWYVIHLVQLPFACVPLRTRYTQLLDVPAILDLTCIHLTFDPQVTLNIADKSLLSQPPRLALDVKVERIGQVDTKELAEPLTFPEKWTKMERHVRALLAIGDVLSEVRGFVAFENKGVCRSRRSHSWTLAQRWSSRC